MKLPNFKLPGAVMIPDGKQAGDTFQAMATLKLNSDGSATLCEIDGEGIDGYKPGNDAETEAGPDDASQPAQLSLQQRLMASSGGAPGM